MQVKIIIGTVAFMISMMVMGYAAVREPARLDRFIDARLGRQIEMGAHIYEQNCATCHGVHGKAEECYDPSSGEPIGCVGLPLNYQSLVCGDLSLRMEAMNWAGTKEAFIQSTITSGRPGTVMPAWSDLFGGPLRNDQIADLSKFVLNWETEELCSTPLNLYDWPESVEDFAAEFPEGDATNGEQLFLTYGCVGCHGNLEDEGTATVGPWLGEIAVNGAERIDGYSAEDYVYESILDSNAFISPECPLAPCGGPPSAMPGNFGLRMGENPQDLADLMTFLLEE